MNTYKQKFSSLAAKLKSPLAVTTPTSDSSEVKKVGATTSSKTTKATKTIEKSFDFKSIESENVDAMSEIVLNQCQMPLEKLNENIEELKSKQNEFLQSVTKEKLWLKQSQIEQLRNMQKAIHQIPIYQAKVVRIHKKMNEINRRVARLKSNATDLQSRIEKQAETEAATAGDADNSVDSANSQLDKTANVQEKEKETEKKTETNK